MRHFRFLLLFAPVAVSVLISLSWLRAHWADVAVNGPGPPLLTGDRLAANISEAGVLEQREYSALGEYVEYARELAMGSADAGDDAAGAAAAGAAPRAGSRGSGRRCTSRCSTCSGTRCSRGC